jgi:hypothetical protein
MRSALVLSLAAALLTGAVAACGGSAPAFTDISDNGGGGGSGSGDASADDGGKRDADAAGPDASSADARTDDADVQDSGDGVVDGGLCPNPAPSGPCQSQGEWCSFGLRGGCTCDKGTWSCIAPPTAP